MKRLLYIFLISAVAAMFLYEAGSAIGFDEYYFGTALYDIGDLTATDGNFIVGDGTTWVAESGATARASLGLGTMAVETAANYLSHSLADNANDFLVASGADTFVRKTLAEAGAILEGDINHGNLQGLDTGAAHSYIDQDVTNGANVILGTIASAKHTIQTSNEPYVFVAEEDTKNSRFVLDRTKVNTEGVLILAAARSGHNLYFSDDGTGTFNILTDSRANLLDGVPGSSATTLWTIDESGNVTGVGTLTGHASLTIDNITIDTSRILSTGDMTISPGAGGDVKIGGPGDRVNISSSGDMVFTGAAAVNGLKLNTVAKTANYDITGMDDVIICGAGNETFTIDLPSPVAGHVYHVKNAGTGIITVDANVDGGTTIDGANTAVLTTQYECITIASNGTVYLII